MKTSIYKIVMTSGLFHLFRAVSRSDAIASFHAKFGFNEKVVSIGLWNVKVK